jgi:uncharacterized protein (TIGR03067 family)
MMRVRILPVAAAVALVGFAPAPLPRQQRPRRPDLTGTWEFVLTQRDGARSREVETGYRVRVTREEFALVEARTGQTWSTFVMRLEPTAAPPGFSWSRNGTVRYVGSYRLQGGQLTMIFNGGARLDQRPTDFEGKPEYRYVLRHVGR